MKFTELTISGPLISNRPPPSSIIWSGLLANDCVGFELNRYDWYQNKKHDWSSQTGSIDWRVLAIKWVIRFVLFTSTTTTTTTTSTTTSTNSNTIKAYNENNKKIIYNNFNNTDVIVLVALYQSCLF